MPFSLLDFARHGTFGTIALGCRSVDLEAVMGPPEMTGGQSRRHKSPSIWKYGNVEFFFERDSGGLHLIHCDTFDGPNGTPKGWGGLSLDPWCIRKGLSLDEFVQEASGAGLEWQILSEPQFERVLILLQSEVQVAFSIHEDGSPSHEGLYAIWRHWQNK